MPLVIPSVLPTLTTLTERFTLEPLGPEHYEGLAAILAEDAIWTQGFGADAQRPLSRWECFSFIDSFIRADGRAIFAIVSAGAREVVGTTGIARATPENERVQIGRTLIAPAWWGQRVNHETKVTFIDWLFECGAGRIECDVDTLNHRSEQSLLAFGFTAEGVRRRSSQRWDGTWRDITVFSIIREEWEDVRVRKAASILSRFEQEALPSRA